MPRWLFALQIWEFPPTPTHPLLSSLAWWRNRGLGRGLSGYKTRWPAFLGFKLGELSHSPPPTTHLPVLGWDLERERLPGLGQHAVHFDPSSLPAWLRTDCQMSVPCRLSQSDHGRSWDLLHPPPHCLLASCPPVPGGRGNQTANPFQVVVGRVFVFVSVSICVNTSLFGKK